VTNVHPPTADALIASRQVDWWSVHEFVEPLLSQAGRWPVAGSVTWRQLDDTDPAKWAALLDAARHHALRVDTAQENHAHASKDVSAAVDWKAISHRLFVHRAFYAERPWLRRAS
jgi:hypothetical protein